MNFLSKKWGYFTLRCYRFYRPMPVKYKKNGNTVGVTTVPLKSDVFLVPVSNTAIGAGNLKFFLPCVVNDNA